MIDFASQMESLNRMNMDPNDLNETDDGRGIRRDLIEERKPKKTLT